MTTRIVDSGVASSCAAPPASVASDARRPFCARARMSLVVTSRERTQDAEQEPDDEPGRDAERDPHALQVPYRQARPTRVLSA